MTVNQVDCFFASLPRLICLPKEDFNKSVVEIIAKLILKEESKSKIKKLIQGNAVYINGKKFNDEKGFLKDANILKGKYFVIRIAGKEFYTIKTNEIIEKD